MVERTKRLVSALDTFLTVSALRLSPAWRVRSGSSCGESAAEMVRMGFDVAPTATDPTMVCVLTDLEAAPSDFDAATVAFSLDAAQILTPSASLGELRRALVQYDFVVVLDTLGGVGVVTHADLAHPAISSSVFHTVMLVEQGLAALLELFDDPRRLAEESLTPSVLGRIHTLIMERERRNLELSFPKSMSLEDRFDLIIANAELWSQIAGSKTMLKSWKKRTQLVRDTLAHSGSLLDVSDDLRGALTLVEDLDGLALHIWSRVIDPLWTRFAFAEIVTSAGDVLAGRGAAAHLPSSRWVITADNSGGLVQGADPRNYEESQRRMRAELGERGILFEEGRVGRQNHWEHSFIIKQGGRDEIFELGGRFGQVGVFELTPSRQLTIRCSDGEVMRSVPRRR